MRIVVRYYARAREDAGTEEEEVQLPAEATLKGLWVELLRRHPSLGAQVDGLTFMIGADRAEWADRLSAGDVVSVLPPVSGG